MKTRIGNPILQSKVFTLDASDIKALGASTTGNLDLMTLSNGDMILGTRVSPKTQTAGASWSALTCSVGDAGSATRYSTAVDVFAAPSDTAFTDASPTTASKSRYKKADTAVKAYLTSTGGNLSACTAGEIEIVVYYINELGPGLHE